MNKKILIVDDAPLMRLFYKDLLTSEGYDVVGDACDGLEAVELYKSIKPDIVLLDIVMPNCDGIDALKRIKEYDDDVHAIIISAMCQAQLVAEALLAGARAFISKPFQNEELVKKIRESSQQISPINRELALQIYDACVDDMSMLATHEVDMIFKSVYSQTDANEVESFIARLKERR